MAVILANSNMDNVYRELNSQRTLTLLNDVEIHTKEDRDNILQSLYTKYTENSIDGIPSCDCGYRKGTYLLDTMCTICDSMVVSPFLKIESTLWLKTLPHVSKFINPVFWRKVDRAIGTIRTNAKQGRRTNIIPFMLWLSNPSFKVHNYPSEIEVTLIGKPITITNSNIHLLPGSIVNGVRLNKDVDVTGYINKEIYINGLEGFQRNYNYMIDNLDRILKKISITSKYRPKSKTLTSLMLEYINNKDEICSNYLPIISNKLFVMEKTSTANYVDMKLGDLTNVVLNYIRAIHKEYRDEKSFISNNLNVTAIIMSKLSENIDEYINSYIASHDGIGRKHIYGSRNMFIFRFVITPIHGPSRYNEIRVPWSTGLVTYKLHLYNKMENDEEVKRLGWTGRKILDVLDKHVKTYHPIIHRLLNEMLAETPDGYGISVGSLRNPGLLPGSLQSKFITTFKTDVTDETVSISILACASDNSDFDGDQNAYFATLDNQVANEMGTLDLSHSVPEYGEPYVISGRINLPAPTVEILSKWIEHNERTPSTKDNILELVDKYN